MVMEMKEIPAEEEVVVVVVKENQLGIQVVVMKLVVEENLLPVMKTGAEENPLPVIKMAAEENPLEIHVPVRQPVTENPPERAQIQQLGDTLIA